MSNQPGTPREDGEMGGNFLNPFQNESVSPLSSTAYNTVYKLTIKVKKSQNVHALKGVVEHFSKLTYSLQRVSREDTQICTIAIKLQPAVN